MEETTTTTDDDEEPVADTILQPVLEVLDAVHAISTESTDDRTQPLPQRRNSAWRANRILGRIVPPLLLAFILNGWYYVQTEISPYLRHTRYAHSSAYMTVFTIMITLLVTLFLLVWLGPNDHSAPPNTPPHAILKRSIPYECIDHDGNLAYCWQDDCNGRWLPPRTRHCKDCRKCRVDFDHCCVFFGTCIAEGNLFLFTIFLLTVAPTIALGLWQVTPVALHHRRIVMEQLWLSDFVYENWWNRWYSWIGGPIFRWGAGLLYSFWLYKPDPYRVDESYLPPVSFTPILYTIFGPLLSVFCLALAWVAIRNVLLASSTIDTIRTARGNSASRGERLVWVPEECLVQTQLEGDQRARGRVYSVPKAVNIYDYGWRQNFRNFLSRTGASSILLASPLKEHQTWTINEAAVRRAISKNEAVVAM